MFKYFLPLFAASLFLIANPAIGQESSEDSDFLLEEGLFKIDFPGGTLESYVQLIRDSASANKEFYPRVNIMLVGPVPIVTPLPPIQVTTNLDGALECLQVCSNDEVAISIDHDSSGEITFIRTSPLLPPAQPRVESVQVFNLKQILVNVPKENVVTAIDIGLEISGNANATEIKLHEETGLLFARGPKDQLSIIEQIVNELTSTISSMNQLQNSHRGHPPGYAPVQTGPLPNPVGGLNYSAPVPNGGVNYSVPPMNYSVPVQPGPANQDYNTHGQVDDVGQQRLNPPRPIPTHNPPNTPPATSETKAKKK